MKIDNKIIVTTLCFGTGVVTGHIIKARMFKKQMADFEKAVEEVLDNVSNIVNEHETMLSNLLSEEEFKRYLELKEKDMSRTITEEEVKELNELVNNPYRIRSTD